LVTKKEKEDEMETIGHVLNAGLRIWWMRKEGVRG